MQLLGSASLMKGRYYILFTGRREEGGSRSAHPPPASTLSFCTASIRRSGRAGELLAQRQTRGIWQSRKPVAGESRVTQTGKWLEISKGKIGDIAPRSSGGRARHASGVGGVAIEAPMSFSFSDLLIFSRRFSLGQRPEDVGAKWSVPEEGHRARVVFGTNTAATLPLLGPSVSFGPTSPGPQRRPGCAIANTLLQQPDHFAQDFSVSTVRGN